MIKINLDKAKEIKKDMLRVERKPLLEALDVQMMRAIEEGDSFKQAEIAEKKQALRDITLLPNTVETVEELKSIKVEA